jgi:hypothetical protein
VHYLPNLVSQLNHTVHKATNMRPIDVNNKNDYALYLKIRKKSISKNGYRNYKPKYRVGDLVRIPRSDLGKHAKGAVAKWTEDLYKIIKIDLGPVAPVYYVANEYGAVYPRRLYEKEINKVSNVLDRD